MTPHRPVRRGGQGTGAAEPAHPPTGTAVREVHDRPAWAHRALPAAVATPMLVLAVPAALVVIAFGVLHTGDGAAGRVDVFVGAAAERLAGESRRAALLIDAVGEPAAVAAMAAVLTVVCLAVSRLRLALVALVATGATGVTTTALKPLVARTIHGEHLAYPSGHTAAVTALALVVALLVVDLTRARRLPALLVVIVMASTAGGSMAWAQIVLQAHYPTDTIGGFCTAVAVVTASALLVDLVGARRLSSRQSSSDPASYRPR